MVAKQTKEETNKCDKYFYHNIETISICHLATNI